MSGFQVAAFSSKILIHYLSGMHLSALLYPRKEIATSCEYFRIESFVINDTDSLVLGNFACFSESKGAVVPEKKETGGT